MTPSERSELALRARAGDRAALDALIVGLQDLVFRVALRFLRDREQARDATQEILVLIMTKLSTFRAESSIDTWVYRVACRHLVRLRARGRKITFESMAEEDLARSANAIDPATLASADARMLEEEVFLACTQAMLQALEPPARIAFVLGALCELDSESASHALGISEAAFKKRLSRARKALDAFMRAHCGVANPSAACRCMNQVNHSVRKGRLDPRAVGRVPPPARTSLETLRAHGEIDGVRRSLALYQAQPSPKTPDDLAQHIRAAIGAARIFDA